MCSSPAKHINKKTIFLVTTSHNRENTLELQNNMADHSAVYCNFRYFPDICSFSIDVRVWLIDYDCENIYLVTF